MNDELVDPKNPTFATTFRVTETNSADIEIVAQYLKSKGYHKVGIIADNTAYGQSGTASVKAILEKTGIPVVKTVDHPVAATNLTAQALTLKQAGVDAVYIFSLGPDAALFMKTIKQMQWDVPTVGGRGLNMSAFVNLAGTAADGIVIPSVSDDNKPEYIAWKKKYDEKYGHDPSYMFALLGYDTGRVVAQVLKNAKGTDGEALIKAMENLKDFPMTLGQPGAVLTWGPDKHEGYTPKYIVLRTVKDGKFVLFDETPPGTK